MVSHTNVTTKKIGAKKSLGQNFLHNKAVISKMVSVSSVSSNDTVIEIGPGKGVLTKELLAVGAHVIAVEKDDRLIPYLQEVFENEINTGQLVLLHADAQNIVIQKNRKTYLTFSNEPKTKVPVKDNYKVVANIPYYITGMLLRVFFEQKILPKIVTVLVQKEVADRIVATSKKESILSLSIKFFGTPKKIMNVSKNNFNPKPKVDSAVLMIETNSKPVDEKTRVKFFDVVRRGFAQKRKTLRKNLIESKIPAQKVEDVLNDLKIDIKTRAEDIDVNMWLLLANRLY